MTDFEKRVLRDYKIDVREINLFRLYQLSTDTVSEEELEAALERCRRKWQTALNSPNERVVAPAKKHLENVQQYEAILRNSALRRELHQYYNSSTASADVSHAQQFFGLVSQTKRITQKDTDFYFSFYPEKRKKKKAIVEMLKTSYKLRESKAEENEDINELQNKRPKSENASLIVNLFRKETLCSIQKCITYLTDAAQKKQVVSKYPELAATSGINDYLKLEKYKTCKDFAVSVSAKRAQLQMDRTEFGADFTSLLDLYNTLDDLLKEKDVIDNYFEFRLLVKYPQLSPYMFCFEEIKPNTLKEFYSFADSIYDFGSFDLFITEYFAPIYDNFGIYDRAIRNILQQAEKRAQSEKLRRTAFEKFCSFVNMPSGIRPKHMTAHWPIFVVYVVFELIKNLVLNIRKVSIIGGSVYGIIHLIHEIIESKLFADWKSVDGLLHAILWICTKLGICAFVICLTAASVWLLWKYAAAIHKTIDWIGMERTFHRLLIKCRDSVKSQETGTA